MRIITKQIEAYKFEELDEKAQQRVLNYFCESAFDFNWYEFTFQDAERIGLKITEFDIGRGTIDGKFCQSAREVADDIIKEHGQTCETYNDAEKFLETWDKIIDTAEKDENGEFVNVDEVDCALDSIEEIFKKDILEDYLSILKKEADYLTSKGAIMEMINANEYEFTKEGKLI